MLSIPSSIVQEIHKLASDGALLFLLKIYYYNVTNTAWEYIYLARSIDDVVWPTLNGNTYQKFWFELGSINTNTSGSVPDLTLQIDNIGRLVEQQVVENDSFFGAICNIYIVNSEHLSETTPLYSIEFQVMKVVCTNKTVSFKLGIQNPIMLLCPSWKFHGSICQYKDFKGTLCGYSGVLTTCNRTIANCIERNNVERFGGQLGILGEIYDEE